MGFTRGQSHAALLRAGGVVESAANLLATRAQPAPSAHSPGPVVLRSRTAAAAGAGGGPHAASLPKPLMRAGSCSDTIMATPAHSLPSAAGVLSVPVAGSASGVPDRRIAGMLSPSMEHDGASSTDISDGEQDKVPVRAHVGDTSTTAEGLLPGDFVVFGSTAHDSADTHQDALRESVVQLPAERVDNGVHAILPRRGRGFSPAKVLPAPAAAPPASASAPSESTKEAQAIRRHAAMNTPGAAGLHAAVLGAEACEDCHVGLDTASISSQ